MRLERLHEIRCLALVWAAHAGWATISAKTAEAVLKVDEAELLKAGKAFGRYGHRSPTVGDFILS